MTLGPAPLRDRLCIDRSEFNLRIGQAWIRLQDAFYRGTGVELGSNDMHRHTGASDHGRTTQNLRIFDHHLFGRHQSSKPAIDILPKIGNVLRLSLLRSSTYPDPTMDKGRQQFMYALYPHAGSWQQAMTPRRAYELNYGLSATQVQAHTGALHAAHSFLTVEGDNVLLTAVKKAEDSDSLILRLFEWQGTASPVRITLPGSPKSVEEVGMMETDVTAPQELVGSVVSTTAKPYEIKTLRVEYDTSRAGVWQGTK